MAKQPTGILFDTLALDRSSAAALYEQLDAQLRQAVLSGRVPPGARLPASRQLAIELGVSRLTVQNTYEQLIAEGFLRAETGSGTFVADIASEDLPPQSPAADQNPSTRPKPDRKNVLSMRGKTMAQTLSGTRISETRAFRPAVPAPELFPMAVWTKLWSRALKRIGNDLFSYGPQGGYEPLRIAIAEHLTNARGVRCHAGQVIVTAGSQQSFALSGLALLDEGDVAWGEDPGHVAGRDVLSALGISVVSVPIDDEGLNVQAGSEREPSPKLIFVTPSHQHPLGVTMSLRRRLELLQFAQQTKAWVLEDDYDSEFRYSGRPLPALQGLDSDNRVIYAGSFSKVLYPSLRIGYLVVPDDLVDAFQAAQTVLSQGVPTLPQVVLAEFMEQGRFSAHIRRMRVAYAERQQVLLKALEKHGDGILEVSATDAGMHLMAWLPDGVSDSGVAEQLWKNGIEAVPLSIYTVDPYPRSGLLLGFTAVPPDQIDAKVRQLVPVVRNAIEGKAQTGRPSEFQS